jgi:hypothetical protein
MRDFTKDAEKGVDIDRRTRRRTFNLTAAAEKGSGQQQVFKGYSASVVSVKHYLPNTKVKRRQREPVVEFRAYANDEIVRRWTPVRARALTRGGYKEQVHGYCRDPRA